MDKDMARRQADQALVATPSRRLGGSTEGFDPSRLESLGFVLRYDDGGERLSVSHDAGSEYWSGQVLIRQYGSDDRVVYVDLADLNWLIGALKLVAIATEAGTAATVKQGAVREGAGPQDIAQPSGGDPQ